MQRNEVDRAEVLKSLSVSSVARTTWTNDGKKIILEKNSNFYRGIFFTKFQTDAFSQIYWKTCARWNVLGNWFRPVPSSYGLDAAVDGAKIPQETRGRKRIFHGRVRNVDSPREYANKQISAQLYEGRRPRGYRTPPPPQKKAKNLKNYTGVAYDIRILNPKTGPKSLYFWFFESHRRSARFCPFRVPGITNFVSNSAA